MKPRILKAWLNFIAGSEWRCNEDTIQFRCGEHWANFLTIGELKKLAAEIATKVTAAECVNQPLKLASVKRGGVTVDPDAVQDNFKAIEDLVNELRNKIAGK